MTVFSPAAVLGARGRATALSRVTVALLLATIAVDAVFFGGLLVTGGTTDPFVNVGLSLATQWIPVTVFWIVVARTGFRNLAVLCAAAGVTLSAIGDSYYALAMDAGGYLTFPSPADAGYLLFYPLMVAALVVLVRRRLDGVRGLNGVRGLVLLEIAVATVGASTVLAVLLDPVIRSALSGTEMLDSLIAVAYPVFDLLLLAVIAGVAAVPTIDLGRRWWSLVTGLSLFIAADVAYALLEHDGMYIAGTPLDAAWAVGLGFITWWAAGFTAPDVEVTPVRRAALIPLPAVAVIVGLAVLVVGTQFPISWLAVALAALTVALGTVPIVFRHAVLGRLLADQEEAVRRLTELDQAKTDIMVTMNHEFRTPLTSINGHVDLLLDGTAGDLPASAIGMLETIERSGGRLQSLIDETLTAAKLDDGQGFAFTPLGISDVVRRAAGRGEAFAASREVELVVDVPDPSPLVAADAGHLERAFVNLVDNAVKFSEPAGRVTIAATTTGRDVVIRITDTGIGIPDDDIPKLFTRFFRASNVRSAAIPGVGLGLSITRQVVRAHGGKVAIDSAVGRGTTVIVRLPLARARRASL